MHLVALALSLVLHLGFVVPYMAWSWVSFEMDSPGDEGPENGAVGDGGGELAVPTVPVKVSIYVEPSRSRAPAPKKAPVAETQPPTEPPPEGDRPAVSTPREAEPLVPGEVGDAKKEGVGGKSPRGKKKPCEPVEEVVLVEEGKWRVERDMLDWYASHLGELDKQAGVGIHKDPDGKRDGARLYLPRCSILKQGGFKNGDIIRSVNGRKVFTIPQAVATYLDVRNEKTVTVDLTRKDGQDLTFKYKLK